MSSRSTWAGHVERMGDEKLAKRAVAQKVREKKAMKTESEMMDCINRYPMWGERNCLSFELAVGGIEPPSPRLTRRRSTARPPLPTFKLESHRMLKPFICWIVCLLQMLCPEMIKAHPGVQL